MKKNRPGKVTLATMVSLNWPITSLSSILHRVTGVLLFLAVPFSLCLLEMSLASQSEFDQAKALLNNGFFQFSLWAVLSMLGYHIIAGVRHLLMDAGIGESLEGGILGSQLAIGLGVLFAVSVGVWLW